MMETDFVTSGSSTLGLRVTGDPPSELVPGRIGRVNENGADAGTLVSHE